MLSPGTPLMGRIYDRLVQFINSLKSQKGLNDWSRIHVEVSPSTEPGEGEHKIVHRMRALARIDAFKQEQHTVYTHDCDVVMLSLPMDDTHIIIISEESTLTGFQAINIGYLRDKLSVALNPNNPTRALRDWVMFMFLCGNDFIGHHINLTANNVESIISVYLKYSQRQQQNPDNPDWYLVSPSGYLNLANFKRFLLAASTALEKKKLLDVFKGDKANRGRVIPSTAELRDFYYSKKFNLDPTDRVTFDQGVRAICTRCVQMYGWITVYYFLCCPSWLLNFPFRHVPLMSDLANVQEWDVLRLTDLSRPFVDERRLEAALEIPFATLTVEMRNSMLRNVVSGTAARGFIRLTQSVKRRLPDDDMLLGLPAAKRLRKNDDTRAIRK